MNAFVQNVPGHRPSRREALVASGCMLLACASLGTAASAAVGDQDSWRFCSKCFSMFWDGSENKGTCPAAGAHVAQGLLFSPHYDDATPPTPAIQYDWRFCSKCFTMFYNGPSKGKCPSGGVHAAQGFNFGLNHDGTAPPSSQTEWRFCQQCFALFYNGASTKGRCPVGGGHVAQGFVFNLPFHPGAADAPAAAPDVLAFDNNDITFGNGIAAGGNSHVKLHRDGSVEFTSHFHDSGATDYYYSITWAIYATDGTIFTFHHRDKIIGHLTSGQADRNSNFSANTTNAEVAQHWDALARANIGRMSAHVAATLGDLVDTGKQALDAALEAATIYSEAITSAQVIVPVIL
jgi:hypothetical protein